MAGILNHSPARIIAEWLIEIGYGTDPERTIDGDWPIYISREPDRPDNVIKVSDTSGFSDGFTQLDGEMQEKPGIQVMIRAVNQTTGYRKAQQIAALLDRTKRGAVTIEQELGTGTGTGTYTETNDYILHAIVRTSNVLALGSDTPAGKRQLFTINAYCVLRKCCD